MEQSFSWLAESYIDHDSAVQVFKALVGGEKKTFRISLETIDDKGLARMRGFAERLARKSRLLPATITIRNRGAMVVAEKA